VGQGIFSPKGKINSYPVNNPIPARPFQNIRVPLTRCKGMGTVPLASGIPVHCAHHKIAPLHECILHPQNPNVHPDAQLTIYGAAIVARGWRDSITISLLSGFVVKGNGGVLAARKLGLSEAPVNYQNYASEDEELADLIAHNRIPELSRTDKDLLKPILAKLSPSGILASVGFTAGDVSKLLAEITPAPQYPITAKLNERHDFIVITCDSETDWQFLKTLAGIRVEQSFKNTIVGEGRVIPFSRFISSLSENRDSIPQTSKLDQHPQAAK
jgi:hypothetical protein